MCPEKRDKQMKTGRQEDRKEGRQVYSESSVLGILSLSEDQHLPLVEPTG